MLRISYKRGKFDEHSVVNRSYVSANRNCLAQITYLRSPELNEIPGIFTPKNIQDERSWQSPPREQRRSQAVLFFFTDWNETGRGFSFMENRVPLEGWPN